MHSRLTEWSRYALLAGIVLALVLVIPTAWFPFQLSKVAAFAVALLACVVFLVVSGGARALLRTHGFYAALLVAALPALYFISSLFSPDRSLSMTGSSVESDTVLFVLFAAVAYLLSFTLFRTLRTARLLMTVVFWSLAAATVFQLVSIIFGTTAIPFQTFTDRSVNLIGKWNDLGLLVSLLSVLLFARIELNQTSNMWRIGAAIGGVVLVLLLGLVNFPLAWTLLLSGCILLGVLAVLRQRGERGADSAAPSAVSMVPWYAVSGTAIAVIFLLYGSAINTSLIKVFPISSLEVRPGLQSTLDLAGAEQKGSARATLIGTGPNTFGISWLKNKPAEVNRTQFWNLDFNVGYSTLATALCSVGFLGAIAWLMPLFLLIAAVVRVIRLNLLSRDERFVASMLGVSSLFLFAAIILYVPSQNIILLAFILSGAAFGFLWRQGRAADDEGRVPSMLEGIGVLAIAGVLLVATVASGFVTARRLVAEAYTGAGLYALAQGDVDGALMHASNAQKIESTANALRLQTDAGAQKLSAIAQDTKAKPEDAQKQFTAMLQSTILAGQAAILASPTDYRSYFALGRVYDLLSSLKITGAYKNAQDVYNAAAVRNPTSPAIPLVIARLDASNNNAQGTQDNITKALTLKPDYTDAILFVVQINVANNDLNSAIKNTQIAVQTAPGVASIWFELGLLYYAGNASKDAIPPLEQALVLAPEYANAKYFLGLAYYAQGRQNDSLRLFEELAVSNPDNAEVKKIVENLKAGKKPLDGLEAPAQNRKTAPVVQ